MQLQVRYMYSLFQLEMTDMISFDFFRLMITDEMLMTETGTASKLINTEETCKIWLYLYIVLKVE